MSCPFFFQLSIPFFLWSFLEATSSNFSFFFFFFFFRILISKDYLIASISTKVSCLPFLLEISWKWIPWLNCQIRIVKRGHFESMPPICFHRNCNRYRERNKTISYQKLSTRKHYLNVSSLLCISPRRSRGLHAILVRLSKDCWYFMMYEILNFFFFFFFFYKGTSRSVMAN